MVDYEIFELGDVRLSTGQTLRAAKLAYKTYGSLINSRHRCFPPVRSE